MKKNIIKLKSKCSNHFYIKKSKKKNKKLKIRKFDPIIKKYSLYLEN
ncbi:MAG: 50S ribosomal protein L33 [Candidatus Nasuia deltocephalinicola]